MDSRPSSIEIIKNWMNFYKKYQADLTQGEFRPLGSFRVPDHRIESENRIFVYIRSKRRVSFPVGNRKEIFLMNASDLARINSSITVSAITRYTVQAYDRYLQPQGAPTEIISNSQRMLDISAVVEQGGMLVLRPLN